MKKGAILGLVTIAVMIAVIIGFYSNSSSYGTFNDAKATSSELHVVGYLDTTVKKPYYDATKDANYFSFYVKDKKGEECKVVFIGTEPQDFRKSEQIVLTGKMTGNEFRASEILMKCPSKYTKDQINVTDVKAKSASL
jgi:cytochrome c-type biogenesis protein CcmE